MCRQARAATLGLGLAIGLSAGATALEEAIEADLTAGLVPVAVVSAVGTTGTTAVDPVRMSLLFERFLSEERGEWPDIDLDLPSGAPRERLAQ